MATSRKYRRVLSHDDDEADDDDHNAAQQLRTENDDSGGGDNGGDDSSSSSGGARRQRTATTSRPASASVSASPSAAVAVAADTRRATPPERLDISLAPVAPASPGRRAASSLVATFSYTEPTYSEDDVRLELGRVSNVRCVSAQLTPAADSAPPLLTSGGASPISALQQVPVRRLRVGGQLSCARGGHGPADPGRATRPPGRRPRQRVTGYAARAAPAPAISGSSANADTPPGRLGTAGPRQSHTSSRCP